MKDEGREKLDQAFDVLERETPDRVSRMIRWLRDPKSKWVRLPIGLLLIVGGIFGFLPVLGTEFLPIGLLLIAQDVPFLRKPMANLTLWLERKWMALKHWWQNRSQKKSDSKFEEEPRLDRSAS